MNPSVTKSGRQLQRLRNSSKRLLKLLYNYKRLFQLLNCRSKIDIIYTLQNIHIYMRSMAVLVARAKYCNKSGRGQRNRFAARSRARFCGFAAQSYSRQIRHAIQANHN